MESGTGDIRLTLGSNHQKMGLSTGGQLGFRLGLGPAALVYCFGIVMTARIRGAR